MRHVPPRLDAYTLLLAVEALEASQHSALARTIEIRRALEQWPDRGTHPAELQRITEAAVHLAKATSLLRRFPIIRPYTAPF
jgi:hypothetical protein